MRLLLRNHRGIANRFDSRKPPQPKEPGIVATVTSNMNVEQFNELLKELEEEDPKGYSRFMHQNFIPSETVNSQEITSQNEQDEIGPEEINKLGHELQWDTVAPHLYYPRYSIFKKRPNEEIIPEKLQEYNKALKINFQEHITLRLHDEEHVKKKSLELFFHKVDIPIIRTYISQGIHFLTSDFFGRLFAQQKMAILHYLLEQNQFQRADFIDNKFLQIYLAHFLNNPKNDFLLNLISYQKHLLKGNWPDDEPQYYQRFCYQDKEIVHDMPIMMKDILTRTQNSTNDLHRLRIYWSMQKMYLFQQDNIDLIIQELRYTYFKTGVNKEQVEVKKDIGKLLNSFSHLPFKKFISNLVEQSTTFKDFMAYFSVSIILLSHLKSMNELIDYDNVEHSYLYVYLHSNLDREQLHPIFLMVFQLLDHQDHRRVDYENFKRSYDSYLRFKTKNRRLPKTSPISNLLMKYKNLQFIYQRNPKAPAFTKTSITLDRQLFNGKINQPPKYFQQKDMVQCLLKQDYQSVLNHFLTTFTFTGQKQKVNTFYKKMKDTDKNLTFKTKNEQAFYKLKLAKQIFFVHSLPEPLSFQKTQPIKTTYSALTLINDHFIDHDEHLLQFDIMNKFNYADVLTKNMKIDHEIIAGDGTPSENEAANGSLKQNLELDLNGNVIDDMQYDSDGNTIKETQYDSEGNPIVDSVQYDSEGNPIQAKYDSDGNTIQVEYDTKGNPIVNESNSNSNTVELDKDGNEIPKDEADNQQQVITNSQQTGQDGTQQSFSQQIQYPQIPFAPVDDKQVKQFKEKLFIKKVISQILFTPQELLYIKKHMVQRPRLEESSEDLSSTTLEEYEKVTKQQSSNQQDDSMQQQEQSQNQQQQTGQGSTELVQNEQVQADQVQTEQQQSKQIKAGQQQVNEQQSGQQQTGLQNEESQNQGSQNESSQYDGQTNELQQNQSLSQYTPNSSQFYYQSTQQIRNKLKLLKQMSSNQQITGQKEEKQQILQSKKQQNKQSNGQQMKQSSKHQNQLFQGQNKQQLQQDEYQQGDQNTSNQDPTETTTSKLQILFTQDFLNQQSTDLPTQYKVKQFRQTTTEHDTQVKLLLEFQPCSQLSFNSFEEGTNLTMPSYQTTISTTTNEQLVKMVVKDIKLNRRLSEEARIQQELKQEEGIEELNDQQGREEKVTQVAGEQYTVNNESENHLQPKQEDTSKSEQSEQTYIFQPVLIKQSGKSNKISPQQAKEMLLLYAKLKQKNSLKGSPVQMGKKTDDPAQEQSKSIGTQPSIDQKIIDEKIIKYLQKIAAKPNKISENGSSGESEALSSDYLQSLEQSSSSKYSQQLQQPQRKQSSPQNPNSQSSSIPTELKLNCQKDGYEQRLPKPKQLKKLEKRYLEHVGKVDYSYNDQSAYAYHLLEQGEITTQQGPEKDLKDNIDNYYRKYMYREIYKKKARNAVEGENQDLLSETEYDPLLHPLFMKRKQDYRRIRNYIKQISDLKPNEQLQFKYHVTPQQVYSDDSEQRTPIYKINYSDIKNTQIKSDKLIKTLKIKPIFEAQRKAYEEKVSQIRHIWKGKRAEGVSEFDKPENFATKEEFARVQKITKGEDVSEEAITQLFNSMYKQGVKKQGQVKINPSKPATSNPNRYNFSKTNKNKFQFCTVSPSTVIHPPVHLSIVDFTKIDQYKTKPVESDFLRTLQTELQMPTAGSGIILAQYLFLQGKSSTKTTIINPKKTLNIQFTSVVGTRTKNYQQYIKNNLFNYALSQQLYTNLLESQISKYNRAEFKKIVAHIVNFHEEITDNIVRLICKICQNEKIGYTFVEIVELIRVNNIKMSSQALEIVTFLWQKFDILNEDMFPFLKLYTRKMEIPLRTQFYSEFCKSLIKTKKFNKLQIITSAILLQMKPKPFKIDSSMSNLKAEEVSQLQKKWKLREQQNYLRLYLELIDVIVTNLDNYVPPFMNEYFDEYLKLKNSLNEKELGLAFICYSLKKDKFVQLINKLDGEPEKGTTYMYDCLMKAILANFDILQDLTERSLDATVLKNRLVLSIPQINKSLVIFKKCSSSNSFSKFLEHCLRFQQTLEQHSDIKREMFFILNNNVEQVSVGGIYNLLDFIFNEKRAKERIEYRAIKLSEEEKSRKLDLIRGTVTKTNNEETKVVVKQEKKVVKKRGKKNAEAEEEEVVAVVQTEGKKQQQLQVKEKSKKEQSTDGSESNKKDQKKKIKKEKKSEREKQASLLDQILAEKQSVGPGEGQAKGSNEDEILGMIKTQGKRHESTKRKCIKSMNRLFQGALELQRQEQAAKVLEAEKKVLATKQPVVEKKKGGAESKKGKK